MQITIEIISTEPGYIDELLRKYLDRYSSTDPPEIYRYPPVSFPPAGA
jgi:hypothetical protein